MIRLGIIGAGGYGRQHVNGFLALQAEDLVRITAVADPSPAVLEHLRQLPELRNAPGYLDYRDMLAAGELDAVVICAPIPLHHEMTLAALSQDLFILLEKPPVPLLSQLEELIAADRNGRVMVAFQNVYSDLIHRLKRDLVAGRIGRLLSVSTTALWPRPDSYYARSGWAGKIAWHGQPVFDGPCTNGMAHFINLALYLAGSGTEEYAMPACLAGELYRARPGLPSYDTGCLAGQLDNGANFFMGFSHSSTTLSPAEILLSGTKGTARLVDDCRSLQSDYDGFTAGSDGRESLPRAFVEFVRKGAAVNRTPLSAMRPYLLATGLMLQSSGSIHPIPAEFIHRTDTEDHGSYFDIENLRELFQQCAAEIIPLGGTGAPWARKTPFLPATLFSEAGLLEALSTPPKQPAAAPAGCVL